MIRGNSVVVGKKAKTETKTETINENKTTVLTPTTGKTFSEVTIVTNVQPDLEVQNVTETANGSYVLTPTVGKDGISQVNLTVNVPTPETETKTVTITTNGTTEVTPTAGKTMTKVTITTALPTYDGTVE